METPENITRIEQGYPGHFIAARNCEFRRNTALVHEDGRALVVSSVGGYLPAHRSERGQYEMVGLDRHFECMVFVATHTPCGCYQIEVDRQVCNDLPWAVSDPEDHAQAQSIHEAQVDYWMEHLDEAFSAPPKEGEQ